MLLRDIALHGKDDLLDHVDLVFVPIYNADGHERVSIYNRPDQRGPSNPGSRTTAQHINLNRDYAKADAPETQAMIALLQRLDPLLYIDTHVSDGFDHGYDVTYIGGNLGIHAQSKAISAWLNGPFRAGVDPQIKAMGHNPILYPAAVNNMDLGEGLQLDVDGPRYSRGYGDYAHIPTIMLEMQCLKPYKQRVLGAYVFLEAAVRYTSSHLEALQSAIAQDRAARPATLPVAWTMESDPLRTIPFTGVAAEKYRSPVSARDELRYLGKTQELQVPLIDQHKIREVAIPKAWWVPAAQTEVISRLELHGIRFERMNAARTTVLDTVALRDVKLGPANEQRVHMSAECIHTSKAVTLPIGSVRVPSDQPKGVLAAALLEPESSDSFFAWGFFPSVLQDELEIERYVSAPLAERLLNDNPTLRKEFQEKLDSDAGFAADGAARLTWVIEHSAFQDPQHLEYPLAREP